MDKKTILNLSVYLLKDLKGDFTNAINDTKNFKEEGIKPNYNLNGKIFYAESQTGMPSWKNTIDTLSSKPIENMFNSSSSAVIICQIKSYYMAITFGYGKYLLNDRMIEKDFGIKTALNMIDSDKLRSIKSASIEGHITNTQKQVSILSSQNDFNIDYFGTLLNGITGSVSNRCVGYKAVTGTDVLQVSRYGNINELSKILEEILSYYRENTYKTHFEWVDNIKLVRDREILDQFDKYIYKLLKNGPLDSVYLASPQIIEWENIDGFSITGMKDSKIKADINYLEYFQNMKEYITRKALSQDEVIKKLHSDTISKIIDDNKFKICSTYDAIITEFDYKGKHYVSYNGNLFQVEDILYEKLNKFLEENIKESNIQLSKYTEGMREEDYNEECCKKNSDFLLFDKSRFNSLSGPKNIEPCDIFTVENQFVHIKKGNSSSNLSHLFAQGKVSAEIFLEDEYFRKQIHDRIYKKIGKTLFKYTEKPKTENYEIIFAIIKKQPRKNIKELPFFSRMNLMITSKHLINLGYKVSIKYIYY